MQILAQFFLSERCRYTKFHADIISVEKIIKNAQRSYKQSNLTTMSKSVKSAYFRHFFAYNIWCIFYNFCQRIWNQHEILRFFEILFILAFIKTFKANTHETDLKRKVFFNKRALDLNLTTFNE